MMKIGQRVKDENDCGGTIVGFYNPRFYLCYFIKNFDNIRKFYENWHRFEHWDEKTLVILQYDKPVRSMTRQEVADLTGIPVDMVTDRIYDTFALKTDTMVLPEDAVRPILQGVKNAG